MTWDEAKARLEAEINDVYGPLPSFAAVFPSAGDVGLALTHIEALEAREAKVREIVDLYFAPPGAAKGERWRELIHDRVFSPEVALNLIRALLTPGKDTPNAG